MITTESNLAPSFQRLWQRGVQALEQKNWPYAIDLLSQVVREAPTFLEARKALRTAQSHAPAGSKLGGLFGGLFNRPSSKDPWQAIADLEETVFPKDPFSISANQKLHDLALALNFIELASFALETIRAGHPEDTRNLHALARHYRAIKQPALAVEVYAAIIQIDPRDMSAVKGEKDAMADASIATGGWQEESDFIEKVVDDEETRITIIVNRPDRTPAQSQEVIDYFSAKCEQDPGNLHYLKVLARVYDEIGNTDLSLKYYEAALAQSPGDAALESQAELVRAKAFRNRLDQMVAYIAANPYAPDVAQVKADLATLRKEHASVHLAEVRARVERNPTDKLLRCELGQALFEAGQYTQAIRELQQARTNSHIRIKAMLLLGRCYAKKEMFDLAQSTLAEAVASLAAMDATKKELLYELALIRQTLGDHEGYLEAVKQIYDADSGYRDVADRVEASYDRYAAIHSGVFMDSSGVYPQLLH